MKNKKKKESNQFLFFSQNRENKKRKKMSEKTKFLEEMGEQVEKNDVLFCIPCEYDEDDILYLWRPAAPLKDVVDGNYSVKEETFIRFLLNANQSNDRKRSAGNGLARLYDDWVPKDESGELFVRHTDNWFSEIETRPDEDVCWSEDSRELHDKEGYDLDPDMGLAECVPIRKNDTEYPFHSWQEFGAFRAKSNYRSIEENELPLLKEKVETLLIFNL